MPETIRLWHINLYVANDCIHKYEASIMYFVKVKFEGKIHIEWGTLRCPTLKGSQGLD
jgi:hypothetical protein